MALGTVNFTPGDPAIGDAIVLALGSGLVKDGNAWKHANAVAAQAIIDAYTGSSAELALGKKVKQAALDALFDASFDLAKFIRGGTSTSITATNVGNFLATITNNYRTLRASIANAADMTTLNAINVNSGWPSNP